MKPVTLKAILVAGLSLLGASAAHAITIHPEVYTQIFTEGKRTATLDGADVSGFAARRNNGDVDFFNIGRLRDGDSALLVGRVAGTGQDSFVSRRASGTVGVNVLNYGKSTRNGRGPFKGTFELLVGGSVVASKTLSGNGDDLAGFSFGPVIAQDQDVELRITSAEGASDYDVDFNVTAVPLPATASLTLLGLGALAFAGRRRKQIPR